MLVNRSYVLKGGSKEGKGQRRRMVIKRGVKKDSNSPLRERDPLEGG